MLYSAFVIAGESVKLSEEQIVSLIRDRYLNAAGHHLVAPRFAIKNKDEYFVLDPCLVRQVDDGWRVETASKVCTVMAPQGTLLEMQKGAVCRPEISTEIVARAFCAWERSDGAIYPLENRKIAQHFGFDAFGLSASREGNVYCPMLAAALDDEWLDLPAFTEGVEARFMEQATGVAIG